MNYIILGVVIILIILMMGTKKEGMKVVQSPGEAANAFNLGSFTYYYPALDSQNPYARALIANQQKAGGVGVDLCAKAICANSKVASKLTRAGPAGVGKPGNQMRFFRYRTDQSRVWPGTNSGSGLNFGWASCMATPCSRAEKEARGFQTYKLCCGSNCPAEAPGCKRAPPRPRPRPPPPPRIEPTPKCPNGWDQVGVVGADIGGCGIDNCNARYSKGNIQQCSDWCRGDKRCKAFNWAPLNGDKNHKDKRVCTRYTSDNPKTKWPALDGSYKQIFCKPTPVPPLPPPPPKPAPPPPAPKPAPPPPAPPAPKPDPPPVKHEWCNIPPEPVEEKPPPKKPVAKPAPAPRCEKGWVTPDGENPQRCYKAMKGKITHDAAEAACRKLGGNLAIIHSAEENSAVQTAISGAGGGKGRAWIGLNDKINEGKWYWPDNSPVSYTSWWRREPNNAGNEDCAEINFGAPGKWNDMPCSKKGNWDGTLPNMVCSKPARGVVPKKYAAPVPPPPPPPRPPPPKPRPPPPPPPFKENCRTIYGGCDGLKGWGVGRGKGWQYLDRLGGGVNKIAQCEGDEYLKGVGVSRCANNTNLRLKMTCCKGKRRVSGRNRDGNCPNAALGWGVGGGKGMQYLDRLGGRPGEKAMCSNNEMMVGLGVTRCANAKNLRLRLKCAERREVMQGALSGNKHTREQKCRTINASCPNAALGWGVGGGKGWQYLDRLGGTPGQIASCPNNQYLKGIGVKRCANAKNLHFTMTCCDQ